MPRLATAQRLLPSSKLHAAPPTDQHCCSAPAGVPEEQARAAAGPAADDCRRQGARRAGEQGHAPGGGAAGGQERDPHVGDAAVLPVLWLLLLWLLPVPCCLWRWLLARGQPGFILLQRVALDLRCAQLILVQQHLTLPAQHPLPLGGTPVIMPRCSMHPGVPVPQAVKLTMPWPLQD